MWLTERCQLCHQSIEVVRPTTDVLNPASKPLHFLWGNTGTRGNPLRELQCCGAGIFREYLGHCGAMFRNLRIESGHAQQCVQRGC